ncbi:MAG: hypothetical protein BWZ02_00002 [Lentisphaerae bacterium ADurb.BinA184]|nr:MAG: hypothetical protein BWZ02_00002 [Lentisphaerae bacterium ADurb.BinA184]
MPTATVASLHRVTNPRGCNALSNRYIGPLLGNGELTLFLDENGAMHDFGAFPAWPSPRIYWAGRRLPRQQRPLVPFGLFTVSPGWEWLESIAWSQELDVRGGRVRTVHRRRGDVTEITDTLLQLDRNLLVVHKSLRGMKVGSWIEFGYRLCPPRGMDLPEGLTVGDGGQDATGAWLDYRLDGVVAHRGRVAAWADQACAARWQGNQLRLRVTVPAGDSEVTLCLALADDLGNEMFYDHTGWAGRHRDHPMLAQAHAALHGKAVRRGDPEAAVTAWRQWTDEAGWAGIHATQERLWQAYWETGWINLPDAPEVQAVWETGMYAIRTQLTRWSVPVLIHGDYFNGQYFWDAMASVRALLHAGHWPLVERLVEHSLSVVPLGMQILDGTGVCDCRPTFEGGHYEMWPAGCSVYEVHASDCPARLAWSWLQYSGAGRDRLERYYPLLWGPAEFFRRWMVYKGPDGRCFTGACIDVNESIPAVTNGAATVASAVTSLTLARRAAEGLGRDPDLAGRWREMADGLRAAPRVNRRGLLAAYDGDEGVSFTPLSLVADPPFKSGVLEADDPRVAATLAAWQRECKLDENWAVAASADLELARQSQDVRNPAPIAWTWPAAEAARTWARVGNGEAAAAIVTELIRCANNFGSLYECKVMTDGYISLPWFVTSEAELSGAISAMLLQPCEDRIDLLPAVPSAWRNLSFQLWAMNRTRVRVTVRDGALRELALSGPHPSWAVRVPRRFQAGAILGPARHQDEDWDVFEVAASGGQ